MSITKMFLSMVPCSSLHTLLYMRTSQGQHLFQNKLSLKGTQGNICSAVSQTLPQTCHFYLHCYSQTRPSLSSGLVSTARCTKKEYSVYIHFSYRDWTKFEMASCTQGIVPAPRLITPQQSNAKCLYKRIVSYSIIMY